MRVGVDPLDRRLLAGLAAPPVGVRDEEQLVVGEEVGQARQVHVQVPTPGGSCAPLPGRKRRRHAAGVGDVFTQRELPVDVEGFAVAPLDGEVVVLRHKTPRPALEPGHGRVGPPVRVVAVLVVVPAGRVEGVGEFVAADRPERAVTEVLGDPDVEHGELHDARGEDDLVPRWVVVRVHRRDRHVPLVPVDRFAQCRPFLDHFRPCHRDGILKERRAVDLDTLVIVV